MSILGSIAATIWVRYEGCYWGAAAQLLSTALELGSTGTASMDLSHRRSGGTCQDPFLVNRWRFSLVEESKHDTINRTLADLDVKYCKITILPQPYSTTAKRHDMPWLKSQTQDQCQQRRRHSAPRMLRTSLVSHSRNPLPKRSYLHKSLSLGSMSKRMSIWSIPSILRLNQPSLKFPKSSPHYKRLQAIPCHDIERLPSLPLILGLVEHMDQARCLTWCVQRRQYLFWTYRKNANPLKWIPLPVTVCIMFYPVSANFARSQVMYNPF